MEGDVISRWSYFDPINYVAYLLRATVQCCITHTLHNTSDVMLMTSHLWPFIEWKSCAWSALASVSVCVNKLSLQSIPCSNPTLRSSTGTCSPPLFLLHLSYLFINYPSLSMRVFLSLSEWSSCNCFSLEQLEAAQRNRIETTFAFKMSWDGEEGGSTALLPYTEQHHLRSLSLSSSPSLPPSLSSIVSLSPSLPPPYLLPPPPPPPFSSMAPLSKSFQRVPRSTGAWSSEKGIVHLVLVWAG